jgi:hypothetical protein
MHITIPWRNLSVNNPFSIHNNILTNYSTFYCTICKSGQTQNTNFVAESSSSIECNSTGFLKQYSDGAIADSNLSFMNCSITTVHYIEIKWQPDAATLGQLHITKLISLLQPHRSSTIPYAGPVLKSTYTIHNSLNY